MKNNLIALLDITYPGANNFFDSPFRDDGSQKWIDFVYTYGNVDCVRSMSLSTFTEDYRKWCRRKGYSFSPGKAEKVYASSLDLIAVFPRNDNTKSLIHQAVDVLNKVSKTIELLHMGMNIAAFTLREDSMVMAMRGIDCRLGSQLIAEIGDIIRFSK